MVRAGNKTATERQAELVLEFQAIGDWTERYKRVIEMGQALPAFPTEFQNDNFKVRGCQSNVWLHARLEDGLVFFQADSDAAIVKGLVAIILYVYSATSPAEILNTPPEFIEKLGFHQNLSQTRVSGLAAMIKQIKFYAIAFQSLK